MNLSEKQYSWAIHMECSSCAESLRAISLIRKMHSNYPSVRPILNIADHEHMFDSLLTGNTDLAVGTMTDNNYPDLTFIPLCRMKVYAVLCTTHPLAEKKKLSIENLNTERLYLINHDDETIGYDNPLIIMMNQHVHHKHDIFVNSEMEALPIAAGGNGILLLPGYRIPPYYKSLRLTVIPISDNVDFPYGIIYKQLPDDTFRKFMIKNIRTICEKAYNNDQLDQI